MNILFAASEVFPFCKTGGLADVAGSLPRSLTNAGEQVAVILPLYESVGDCWRSRMTFVKHISVSLAWRQIYCGLFRLELNNVVYYFVDNEYYYNRTELYGHYDDGERFGFFSRAIVELLPHLDWIPDIIHCNDWQTALVPVYLREESPRRPDLRQIKTVFTIHNIEYQGRFARETLEDLFGLPALLFDNGTLEYNGDVCLLKGGLICCDFITAVSPTYAQELKYPFFAHGMDGILKMHSHKLRGVLNGIDTDLYNPETDPALIKNYSADMPEGKSANKRQLQKVLGLREDAGIPVIACISRLVEHKGMDLIVSALSRIMELPVQLVLLGRGDLNYEQFFLSMQAAYPSRLSANILYSPGLSTGIYAGADIFLMPSKSEPCGLSQMIAMRYGTVPVVRETGGLKDTVSPYIADTGAGCGFTFANFSADDMLDALRRAVDAYCTQKHWAEIMKRGMRADFSWTHSAIEYKEIYRSICGH